MRRRGNAISSQEKAFAARYAATGDALYAAEKAGYASVSAQAHKLLQRPNVQGEVRRHQLARLENELMPLAINLLAKVLADDAETTRNRLTAAKITLDAVEKVQGQTETKHINEKSAAELRAIADQVEARLAALAIDVTPGAQGAQDAPNLFD